MDPFSIVLIGAGLFLLAKAGQARFKRYQPIGETTQETVFQDIGAGVDSFLTDLAIQSALLTGVPDSVANGTSVLHHIV
ncbi:MAG: hypothetical protein GY845_35390 [Planctomycetes bacterium]|nr:hypothetical protein [Planctomycetota bacterium]